MALQNTLPGSKKATPALSEQFRLEDGSVVDALSSFDDSRGRGISHFALHDGENGNYEGCECNKSRQGFGQTGDGEKRGVRCRPGRWRNAAVAVEPDSAR